MGVTTVAGLGFADMARADAFALFGTLFSDALSSGALLEEFGADPAQLIPFNSTTPALFWREVCREIVKGRFPGTLEELLLAARRQYPYNDALRGLLDHAGGVGLGGGPAELRILLLQSSPTDLGLSLLTQEHQVIRDIVAVAAIQVSLTVHTAVRPTTVLPAVLDVRPHVVHFAGHGSASGALAAQDESGRAAPIAVEDFADVLEAVDSVRALVLGACKVGGPAAAPGRRFDVIGCEGSLSGVTALAFSRGFYHALVRGYPAPECYKFGLSQIRVEGCDASGFRFWPAEQTDGS